MSTLPQLPLALLPPEDRRSVVQTYLARLEDRTRLLICKLYSLGNDDRTVAETLHLTPAQLTCQKRLIAQGILNTLEAPQ